MNILIVSSRFLPHVGGVEEVVLKTATTLSKTDSVTVLSTLDTYSSKRLFKIQDEEFWLGKFKVKRIWLNSPEIFSAIATKNFSFSIIRIIKNLFAIGIFPVRFLISLLALNRYIKKNKPDLLHLHFLDDVSIYIWAISNWLKIPIVLSVHGHDLQSFSNYFPYNFLFPRLSKKATKIVVNSAYMKAELLAKYPQLESKVAIVPNGLSLKEFDNVEPIRYFEDQYIFYVGRLVNKKGVDVLLNAFKMANIPNLKLLVEGSGEELDVLIRLSESLGIVDSIKFTKGKLSNQDKIAFLKGSLFGIIPSRLEPFGIVALEYFASGIPVIASRTGGLISLISDSETGLLFENENIKDLSTKIITLHNDRELRSRLSENAKKEVTRYSWEKICELYKGLYLESINKI